MAANNRKIVTIPLIVVASLVAAVLIFGVVLGLMRAPLAPKYAEPTSIQIITSGGFSASGNASALEISAKADKPNYDKLLKALNKSSDYSQLTTAMERRWFKSYNITTEKDKNDKTVNKELKITDINAIAASEADGSYLVVLRYLDKKHSVEIDGIKIEYNTVYMTLKDDGNSITAYKMYFVDFDELTRPPADDIEETDREEYVTYEVNAWGRQSVAVNAIKDVLSVKK